MTTVKNIYDYINSIAPFSAQEDYDNSGFLCGDFRHEVKTAVLSLDATKEAVEFAKGAGADLLLTHHPILFRGVKHIYKNSALYSLIESNIAHISAHTSFDKAQGGINDNLASILGLENVAHIGETGIVTGTLKEPMSIDDFAVLVGEMLDSHGLRYTDTEKEIKRVALGGGACEEYIGIAMENADCFVTGDLKYHDMLDAQQAGFAVISAGHFETENAPFLMLMNRLEKIFPDVQFIAAPVNNPILEI